MDRRLEALLSDGPHAINVGVYDFAAALLAQGGDVRHVDWSPPAGGDQEMIDLLEKLL